MSVFFDRAEKLASYLSRVAGLESFKFVVKRAQNIDSELERIINLGNGVCVIAIIGGDGEPETSSPRITWTFELRFACLPTLRRKKPPIDDIVQLALSATQQWDGDTPNPNKAYTRFEVGRVNFSDDLSQAVAQFRTVTQFPKTAIILNP